jgi:hypothetical protein
MDGLRCIIVSMRLLVALAFSVLVLTSCGGDPADEASSESTPSAAPTSESPSPSESSSPTETATPIDDRPNGGVSVQFRCEGARYTLMEAAWMGYHPNCIDTKATGEPSKREAAAVRLAYGENTTITASKVEILYGVCGSNNQWWPGVTKNDADSAAAAQEVIGASLLCPNHPHADQVKAYVKRSLDQAEADKNRIQYDGTYLVGRDLNPGTYVSRPTGGCYWERTDRNGEIIDNNFSNGARVQFTVKPSDFSISVQGCGEWSRAN